MKLLPASLTAFALVSMITGTQIEQASANSDEPTFRKPTPYMIHGGLGPCSNREEQRVGYYALDPEKHIVRTESLKTIKINYRKSTRYKQYSYSKGYKTVECKGSLPTFRYYKTRPVHRIYSIEQFCHNGSCNAGAIVRHSWKDGHL